MASGSDNQGKKPAGKPVDPAESPHGRITVDPRGRNVWQWENEDESTSILLKQLENDALALEPTRKVKRPDVDEPESAAASGARDAPAAGKGGRDDRGRIRQYPDRSSSRGGSGAARSAGRPAGPPRRGGGFDPYNNT